MKINTLKILEKTITHVILTFCLFACTSQKHEKSVAFLPTHSAQARTEIIELISHSLGGKKIPIAKDVFQSSSRLLLGKKAVTSPIGIKVLNSNHEPTIVFELLKQGDSCLLRRVNTKQEWLLKTKLCFKAKGQ